WTGRSGSWWTRGAAPSVSTSGPGRGAPAGSASSPTGPRRERHRAQALGRRDDRAAGALLRLGAAVLEAPGAGVGGRRLAKLGGDPELDARHDLLRGAGAAARLRPDRRPRGRGDRADAPP